jgi:hypothetical protein
MPRAMQLAHLPIRAMKKNSSAKTSNEPLGIIISQGDTRETTPVFSAYIWGPVPEVTSKKTVRAA